MLYFDKQSVKLSLKHNLYFSKYSETKNVQRSPDSYCILSGRNNTLIEIRYTYFGVINDKVSHRVEEQTDTLHKQENQHHVVSLEYPISESIIFTETFNENEHKTYG